VIERKFIREGITRSKLNAFLGRKLRRAGYVGVNIEKTPVMTRLAIRVERPGLVIGRKGSTIRDLTTELQDKFGLENVQIKVDEVAVPELDAAIMARRIASSLERGINFRRIMHWSIDRIMASGAKGAEIVVAGKLQGKGAKARKERVAAGYIKKAGDYSKLVNVAHAQALRKAGIIGVTVRIVPPTVVFPDKAGMEKKATEVQHARAEAQGSPPAGAGGTPSEAPAAQERVGA
jgi:small subunit ribosomal protein S3